MFTQRLDHQQSAHLYRTRYSLYNRKKALLNFSSNDYLGLANHPSIINAFKKAAEKYGISSSASHLLGGYHPAHQALEEKLAAFTGYPKALLFSTGYMANLGIVTALLGKGDLVLQDRLNHASLIDAGKFCAADFKRYLHSDMDSLQKNLLKTVYKTALIISDGIFSMNGTITPLLELNAIAQQSNALLMIDDAHGLGVLGKTGGGTSQHFNLKPTILTGTFGKAFGTFGAFVASNEIIIETLIQFARPYIYTTAPPPALAQATLISLQLIQQETWRREKLSSLINYFKDNAQQLGINLLPSNTPIQALVLHDASTVMQVHQKLLERGIVVGAIRPPTVAPKQARLRITLNTNHTKEHIDRLLDDLAKIQKVTD